MIDFYDGPDFAVRMLHSYHRVMNTVESIYEKPNRCGAFNNHVTPKLTGFTQVKGRRRLSKKQRKQLKNRKK